MSPRLHSLARPLGLALVAGTFLALADEADAQRRRRPSREGYRVRVERYERYEDRSNTRGLLLEGTVNATGLYLEDEEAGLGGGLGARLGYGLTDNLTLFVGVNGAVLEERGENFEELSGADELGYGSADLGLEVNFGAPRSALVPYVQLALSGAALTLDEGGDDDLIITGGGVSGALGFKYYAVPTLALNVGVGGTVGQFTEFRYGSDGDSDDLREDLDFTTIRAQVGLSFYPLR